jgi:hypothetical protein
VSQCGQARGSVDDVDDPQLTRVMVMLDFLMIVAGVGFFVAAILYVLACEQM